MSPIEKAWRYLQHGPSHLAMYSFGRFGAVRLFVRRLHRRRARVGAAAHAAPVPATAAIEPVDVDLAANAIHRDGYFPGLRLRPEILAGLTRFSATTTCLAEGDSRFPFVVSRKSHAEQSYRMRIRVGRFDHAMPGCREAHALAADPTIIAIASKYLGCPPVFLGARIWWSFPANADTLEQMSMGQGFHYDLDGYAAVAFFFYLTDVGPATGPHIIVRGSHVSKPWKSVLSLHKGRPDAEIEKWYGKENQVMLCGQAGSGFAEDLFCYHKGAHPHGGDRLMLQLRYGIRKYYAA